MKCPKCGREIPDGSLFCKYCFAEIRIVPTYESRVEEKIHDVMQSITDDVKKQAKSEQENRRLDEKRKKRIRIGFLTAIAVIAASAAIFAGVTHYHSHTASYAKEQAAAAAENGDYAQAARILQDALTSSRESQPDLMLLRASYLEKAGHYEEAVSLCKLILSSSSSSEEQIQAAYGTIIQVYQDTQEYAKIYDMLASCGDESVQEMYSEYMVYVPEASSPSGSYVGDLTLELTVTGDSSIFYTTSGKTPTTKDTLYTEPLRLGPGSWTITAIAVNHYGLSSDPVRYFYTVTGAGEAGEGATEQAEE
jgi:uncharacterized Zn finger protein (UPF0148 family)